MPLRTARAVGPEGRSPPDLPPAAGQRGGHHPQHAQHPHQGTARSRFCRPRQRRLHRHPLGRRPAQAPVGRAGLRHPLGRWPRQKNLTPNSPPPPPPPPHPPPPRGRRPPQKTPAPTPPPPRPTQGKAPPDLRAGLSLKWGSKMLLALNHQAPIALFLIANKEFHPWH